MRFDRRKIPPINAGASADIAFLLLVFFLITSSFDSKTGLYRKMPSPVAENVIKKRQDIEQRNLLTLTITADNHITCENETIAATDIRPIAQAFITASDIPQHVISLEISPDANYQTYLSVLSELTATYNFLRNDYAQTHFQTDFNRLTDEQKAEVRNAYPMHISESESKTERSDTKKGIAAQGRNDKGCLATLNSQFLILNSQFP